MPENTPLKDAPKPVIVATMGDITLLEQHKIAFLCSRQIPAGAVLRCYDWATCMRDAGQCVLSGFHSQIEKDVLFYLLKGSQPLILVLARGLMQRIDKVLTAAVKQGRLLIITPFSSEVVRVTEETAGLRNEFMLEIADEVVVGYLDPKGRLLNYLQALSKPIQYLEKNGQ